MSLIFNPISLKYLFQAFLLDDINHFPHGRCFTPSFEEAVTMQLVWVASEVRKLSTRMNHDLLMCWLVYFLYYVYVCKNQLLDGTYGLRIYEQKNLNTFNSLYAEYQLSSN